MKKTNLFNFSFIFLSVLICTSFAIPKQTPISGNKDWTNTDYTVKIGDKIEIISGGEISINGTIKCNPDGIPNRPDILPKYVIKTSNYGCLIGKIGEKGIPFFVGRNSTIISEETGTLFLGINDIVLKNNTGAFLSIITIISMNNNNQVGK